MGELRLPGKEYDVSAEKQQKYEEYITGSSPMAAVTGRREPYHLTFIKKYGAVPVPEMKDGNGNDKDSEKYMYEN